MATVFTDEDGAIFVQTAPGRDTHYLGSCFDVSDLPNPKGARTPIWCLDEYRNFQAVGSTKSAPGDTSVTVTGLLEKTTNWMETFVERNCPYVIHFMETKCGSRGVYGNWERMFSYIVWDVTDDVISNLTMRETGASTTRAWTMAMQPGRIDSRELRVQRQTTASVADAEDIWACDTSCTGECGPEVGLGQNLQIAYANVGAATADVGVTVDNGTTWAVAAADPFAISERTAAGWCFQVD